MDRIVDSFRVTNDFSVEETNFFASRSITLHASSGSLYNVFLFFITGGFLMCPSSISMYA